MDPGSWLPLAASASFKEKHALQSTTCAMQPTNDSVACLPQGWKDGDRHYHLEAPPPPLRLLREYFFKAADAAFLRRQSPLIVQEERE